MPLFRSARGQRPFRIRPAVASIEALSLTLNGEGIPNEGATVSVGDVLGVTVTTDPSGNSGKVYVGEAPRADCALCGFDCDPPSNHFLERNFTDDQEIQLQISDEWVNQADGGNLQIQPSIKIEVGGDEFCQSSVPVANVNVSTGPVSPAGCTINSVTGADLPEPIGSLGCIEGGLTMMVGLGIVSEATGTTDFTDIV